MSSSKDCATFTPSVVSRGTQTEPDRPVTYVAGTQTEPDSPVAYDCDMPDGAPLREYSALVVPRSGLNEPGDRPATPVTPRSTSPEPLQWNGLQPGETSTISYARRFIAGTRYSRRSIAVVAIGNCMRSTLARTKIAARFVPVCMTNDEKITMVEDYFDMCIEHANHRSKCMLETEKAVYTKHLRALLKSKDLKPQLKLSDVKMKINKKINQHFKLAGLSSAKNGMHILKQERCFLDLKTLYAYQPPFNKEDFLPAIVL